MELSWRGFGEGEKAIFVPFLPSFMGTLLVKRGDSYFQTQPLMKKVEELINMGFGLKESCDDEECVKP